MRVVLWVVLRTLSLSRARITAANSRSMLMGICSSKQKLVPLSELFFTRVVRLVDPYVQPTLIIRAPGSDFEQVHRFENDDPFFSEVNETRLGRNVNLSINPLDIQFDWCHWRWTWVCGDSEYLPRYVILLFSSYNVPSILVFQTLARLTSSLGLSEKRVRRERNNWDDMNLLEMYKKHNWLRISPPMNEMMNCWLLLIIACFKTTTRCQFGYWVGAIILSQSISILKDPFLPHFLRFGTIFDFGC